MRARVLVRPKLGILDPQGQAVERALPALGFSGVGNVHVGRLIELDVEDPAQLPEMCERLLSNPLIEDYEIVEDAAFQEVRWRNLRAWNPGRWGGVKFGVIRFPGSCDDVDALLAAAAGRRRGDALARRPRPPGRRRGDRPRRVLLRRLPACRRDRALRSGDGGGRRVRARRADSCSASAMAFRFSARRGCCPARCSPTSRCASSSGRWSSRWPDAGSPFTRACEPGERLSIPVKHTTGRYYAPEQELDRLEAAGQVLLRYAPGHNPNGSPRDIAGVCNEARQRVRADAPPRARGRSADGLDRRAEDLRVDASARCRPSPRLGPPRPP